MFKLKPTLSKMAKYSTTNCFSKHMKSQFRGSRLEHSFLDWAYLSPIFLLIQIQLIRLLVGSIVGLLIGKSYHTKQKDGYSLPTNSLTNNRINWIWMSKKIGLKYNNNFFRVKWWTIWRSPCKRNLINCGSYNKSSEKTTQHNNL